MCASIKVGSAPIESKYSTNSQFPISAVRNATNTEGASVCASVGNVNVQSVTNLISYNHYINLTKC